MQNNKGGNPGRRQSATTDKIARDLRRVLRLRGSLEHARGVQWFFKEEVRSRGWYTGDLRRLAAAQRRQINSPETLLRVADALFSGDVLEEKVLAVLLLEKSVPRFSDREFRLFDRWLDRVCSWADHDALVHYLIGPLIAADQQRVSCVFRWAKSRNRWRRRAAAVALIRAVRRRTSFEELRQLCGALLDDRDDMVQKGLGWLLREAAKADPQRTVPLLMSLRERAPRLVLRTACETLPAAARARVLGGLRPTPPRHAAPCVLARSVIK